ncbi:MAG TPA: phosphatase PAP2 family protein [Pyrinomonadaceae bacterium]|nr:phosphatase PAP2 family protein [Pyrinomonadaceae bacterium]
MTTEHSSKQFRALHLIAGLLVFTGMTLTLGEIAEDVRNGEPLTLTDVRFSNWLHTHGSPPLTKVMWIITSLHASVVVCGGAVLVGLYLWRRRQRFWVVAFWLSVFGGLLLNKILKLIFHRARPQFRDTVQSLTSYSFPSGHTMIATVFYGALAVFVIANSKSWLLRIISIAVALVMIMLVAFSRIYLGAHYLSDVLAAMAEGLAWIALSLTGLYYFWNRNRAR